MSAIKIGGDGRTASQRDEARSSRFALPGVPLQGGELLLLRQDSRARI